ISAALGSTGDGAGVAAGASAGAGAGAGAGIDAGAVTFGSRSSSHPAIAFAGVNDPVRQHRLVPLLTIWEPEAPIK
ncbi:MAG: SMC-Scp complex subunit ScpB, partial [Betaproteobacteria bacterium]|nr:SMC-Scp complex subunit ScpB [Betaproteobacteria bacterium]